MHYICTCGTLLLEQYSKKFEPIAYTLPNSMPLCHVSYAPLLSVSLECCVTLDWYLPKKAVLALTSCRVVHCAAAYSVPALLVVSEIMKCDWSAWHSNEVGANGVDASAVRSALEIVPCFSNCRSVASRLQRWQHKHDATGKSKLTALTRSMEAKIGEDMENYIVLRLSAVFLHNHREWE